MPDIRFWRQPGEVHGGALEAALARVDHAGEGGGGWTGGRGGHSDRTSVERINRRLDCGDVGLGVGMDGIGVVITHILVDVDGSSVLVMFHLYAVLPARSGRVDSLATIRASRSRHALRRINSIMHSLGDTNVRRLGIALREREGSGLGKVRGTGAVRGRNGSGKEDRERGEGESSGDRDGQTHVGRSQVDCKARVLSGVDEALKEQVAKVMGSRAVM